MNGCLAGYFVGAGEGLFDPWVKGTIITYGRIYSVGLYCNA